MRNLTQKEIEALDDRRRAFDAFLEEMMPLLGDFAEAIGLKDPHMIAADPASYVGGIDAFMREQVIESNDRVWIQTRLGCFIGEVLNQKLAGCWFLNELPDTRYFLRYVVGQFGSPVRGSAMVDPFEAAGAFLDQPSGRRLGDFIEEILAECVRA